MTPGPAPLELFASDEQLAELEARLAGAPDDGSAAAMALAWALRQRDPARSLELARAAAAADPALAPRLWLIEGERAAAHGRLDQAQALCERAAAAFRAAADPVAGVDAELLAYTIVRERSTLPVDLVPAAKRWLAVAEAVDEPGRLAFSRACVARVYAWISGGKTDPQHQALAPPPEAGLHPAAAAHLAMYQAMSLSHGGDNTGMFQRYAEAHALALKSGQSQFAVTIAVTLALMHDESGESAVALEWGQLAMALARQVWPARLSECLWTNARLLRHLEQLAEARELALECVQLESSLPDSRSSAHAQLELGLIALDGGDPAAALAIFERGLEHPAVRTTRRSLLLIDRADALLRLQRFDEAEASAEEALQMDPQHTLRVHRLRARALLADAWLGQGHVDEARQAHESLLADSEAEAGYGPQASTLEGAARAYAAAGLHARAYALSQRAGEALKQRSSRQAEQRSRALYAQFRNERAQMQAERLAALERSHSVLERLGTIGRELTAQLDADRALAVLARHVRSLLQTDCLMVYLLDASGQRLDCALCEDQGLPVDAPPRPLDDPVSLIARCARERQVLLLKNEGEKMLGYPLPGSTRKRSLLYAPLTIGHRLVGVISVQAEAADAFGPEHRLIFGTFCAYAAIALDNARAYRQLDDTQRQLRAQERMASMGVLVAGISHELNTPLGNAVLAISTLRQSGLQLKQDLEEGSLRRSRLLAFVDNFGSAIDLVDTSLQRLATLSGNFKQVAQDRSQLVRQQVPLLAVVDRALKISRLAIDNAGHQLEIDVDPALRLDTFVAPLAQALVVALANAWQHGLSSRRGGGGRIRLQAERIAPLPEQGSTGAIRLSIEDNGVGMEESVRMRAFEPFFTTRMGPHTGLGLTILHGIVADMLGGAVKLESTPSQGTTLTLDLPPMAPE